MYLIGEYNKKAERRLRIVEPSNYSALLYIHRQRRFEVVIKLRFTSIRIHSVFVKNNAKRNIKQLKASSLSKMYIYVLQAQLSLL